MKEDFIQIHDLKTIYVTIKPDRLQKSSGGFH